MKSNKKFSFNFRFISWPIFLIAILAVCFWPKFEPDNSRPPIWHLSDNSGYARQVWQDKELKLLLPPPEEIRLIIVNNN